MSTTVEIDSPLEFEPGATFRMTWTLPYGAAADPDGWMPGQGFTLDAWGVRWRAELVSAHCDHDDDGRVRILAVMRLTEHTPVGYGPAPVTGS